ncbi:hypothetical protein D048_1162B, partial [Vibrio parahaemolyticus VPTS-2009]
VNGNAHFRFVGQFTVRYGVSDFGVTIEVFGRCEHQLAINNLNCTLVTRHRRRVNA